MKTLEHKEFSVKCGEDLEDSIFGKSNGMILNDDNDKRKESIAVLKSKQVSKGTSCTLIDSFPNFNIIKLLNFIWHRDFNINFIVYFFLLQ